MADGAVVVVGGTRAIGLEIARHYVGRGRRGRPDRPGSRTTSRPRSPSSAAGRDGLAFDLAEPTTIAPALADVGPVRRLALVAIDRDHNTVADYDIARAIRLVTLKLVGYTEVVHALRDRLTDDASVVLFGGMAKERPYPGSTTVTHRQRRRRRPDPHPRRGAQAAARQLDPPGRRRRQPVLGGEDGGDRALRLGDADRPARDDGRDRRCGGVPAREHGGQRRRSHRRRRLALPVGRTAIAAIRALGPYGARSRRLPGGAPALELGVEVEWHHRALALVLAPRLARDAPHDLELVAVGVRAVERLAHAVVGRAAEGSLRLERLGGRGEIVDRRHLPGEVVQADRAARRARRVRRRPRTGRGRGGSRRWPTA